MKENKLIHKLYDIFMSILAVLASVLIVIDSSQSLTPLEHRLTLAVYGLFAADLIVRAAGAGDKAKFFRRNFWDVIALIPIHGIFPPVSDPRLDTVLCILDLVRIVAFLARPLRKARPFYNTNGFKYILFATAMTIIVGGVLIHYAEGMRIGDGIWWAFVTATTVGYGDISPHSVYGRLIAMVLMLVGIGLIGSLTSTLTSFFLERRRRTVKDSVLGTVKEELDRFDELSPEEVDEICRLLKAMKEKR